MPGGPKKVLIGKLSKSVMKSNQLCFFGFMQKQTRLCLFFKSHFPILFHFGITGVDGKCPVIRADRLGIPSEAMQRDSTEVPRIGIIRVDGDCLIKRGEGFGMPSEIPQPRHRG